MLSVQQLRQKWDRQIMTEMMKLRIRSLFSPSDADRKNHEFNSTMNGPLVDVLNKWTFRRVRNRIFKSIHIVTMQEQYAASTSMEADVQGMPEFVSDKISNEMTQQHAVDTLLKVDVQGMPEFVSEKINNGKMEQHTTGTSIELNVQGMPGFVSNKINGEKTKEHTPDILMKVDMLDKIQDSPDPLQGT